MWKRPRPILLAALLALTFASMWWLIERTRTPAARAPLGTSASTSRPTPPAPTTRRDPRRSPLLLTPARTEEDVALEGGAFEGHVVSSATGRGIANAELSFEHAGVTSSTRTTRDGSFVLRPTEEGTHDLVLVTAPDHLPFAPEWGTSPIRFVARRGQRVTGITIALTRGAPYVAVVRDPDGRPVAKAEVRVIDTPHEAAFADSGAAHATDDRGEAKLTAPDDALVEARHPAFGPGRARVDVGAQASRRVVIRMTPKGSTGLDASIAGRVVDRADAPVAGAIVGAGYDADNPGHFEARLRPSPRAVTDEEGRFVLEGLDEGRYTVVATHEGQAQARVEGVASGTRDLTLRLTAGGAVRGRVTDAESGRPVTAFSIIVARERGPIERETERSVSIIDAEGRYEIGGLVPGGYIVTAVAHGYAPSASARVSIDDPPGEPAKADIALARGARVTGVVLEQDGAAPIEGARVALEGLFAAGSAAIPLLAATQTDATGRFELTGLAAGLRSLTVTAKDHHGRVVSGLSATGTGDIGPITVELAKTKDGEEARLELTGIGAVLSAKDDALVIGDVLPGGGAAEAGLGKGDAILAVEGRPVVAIGFDAAIQTIRGPEGSTVMLNIRKAEGGEPLDVLVRRRRVRT